MVLNEYVIVKGYGNNIKYYQKLGYDLKHKGEVYVKIEDLNKSSNVKVNVKCSNNECNIVKNMTYNAYNNIIDKSGKYYCTKCCKKFITQKTNLKKYGVDNVAKVEEIKNKTINTNLERYGVKCTLSNEKVRKKADNTLMEKYSVDNISKLKETQLKINKTNLERYGVNRPIQNNKILKKIYDKKNKNCFTKYEKDIFLNNEEYRFIKYQSNTLYIEHKKKCNTIFNIDIKNFHNRKKYDVLFCTICNPINILNSNRENQLFDYINSIYNLDITQSDRIILGGKELDIYIPSKNLAIEFNGLYWHSELKIDKNYHKEKTELCEQKGISLLHIYEDDWIFKQDIIKSIIKNKLGIIENKIYARKCIIKEVDSKTTRSFLDNNHIQGFSNSSYKLGLYYNNELVSIMTFGYRRTNSKKEFELIRFCNKINTNVVGAASKLFKHFIKNYSKQLKESYLISYADISLFDGSLYNTLGFSFKHRTKPNYFWVVNNKREHRFKYNKQKLIKNGANPNLTEKEIMYEKGHYRIFSSGQDRYEFYF